MTILKKYKQYIFPLSSNPVLYCNIQPVWSGAALEQRAAACSQLYTDLRRGGGGTRGDVLLGVGRGGPLLIEKKNRK